jgi:L-asparaginase II
VARTDRGVTLKNNIENWEAVKPRKKVARKRSNLKGHALPVCETGKLRYRDYTQAQDALTVAKHSGATARELGQLTRRNERRSYACPVCNGFHLTSQTRPGVEVGA